MWTSKKTRLLFRRIFHKIRSIEAAFRFRKFETRTQLGNFCHMSPSADRITCSDCFWIPATAVPLGFFISIFRNNLRLVLDCVGTLRFHSCILSFTNKQANGIKVGVILLRHDVTPRKCMYLILTFNTTRAELYLLLVSKFYK